MIDEKIRLSSIFPFFTTLPGHKKKGLTWQIKIFDRYVLHLASSDHFRHQEQPQKGAKIEDCKGID